MAQRRRKRSKKWLGKLVFVVLLVAAGVVCYFVWDGYFRDKSADVEDEAPKSSGVVVVEEEESVVGYEEPVNEKQETVQYDGENPNESVSITGAITYASVVGGNLVIRVNIDQYLSGGSCKLSLIQDGVVVFEDNAVVIDSASTSTCEGFNVPVARLGSGRININIAVISGDKNGTISGEVEI